MKRGKYEEDAYLTVFLSLTLAIILSLVFALVEAAEDNAVRMRSEVAMNAAADSCLAEYNRELQEQYDLFFVDTSYEGDKGTPSIDHLGEEYSDYVEKNLVPAGATDVFQPKDWISSQEKKINVEASRSAAYKKGYPVRQQIYAYLTAGPISSEISNVLDSKSDIDNLDSESGIWEQKKQEFDEELANAETMGEPKDGYTDANGDGVITEDEMIDVEAGNPMQEVEAICGTPVLSQVLGASNQLSEASVETSNLLSHRKVVLYSQFTPENSHKYASASDLFMMLYAMEKFGNWRDPMEKGALKYQAEYMLFQKSSDKDNLEKMAERLLALRLTSNTIYLFSNEAKRAEAETMAGVVSAIILSPELESVFTTGILLAWSYAESLKDVSTILNGGKVPVGKDDSTWKTSIWSILSPGAPSPEDCGTGPSYEDYLRIFLVAKRLSVNTYPMMDMMEADIRKATGNDNFTMDGCVDAFKVDGTFDYGGREFHLTKEASYN